MDRVKGHGGIGLNNKSLMIAAVLFVIIFSYTFIASSYASAPRVISVSLGMFHGLALKDDGTVWAWGGPYPGKDASYIGTGIKDTGSNMLRINITNVTDVSAGSDYCLALKDDGTVWAWGYNDNGELGDGTYIDSTIPVQVKGLHDIIAISADEGHNMALGKDGIVWTWGQDKFGQLGDGTISNKSYGQNTPVAANITNVKSITGGTRFCEVIKEDGTVWGWGDNSLGHLGTALVNETILFPVQVYGISNVTELSACSDQTIALKDDGTVWEWGNIRDNDFNFTRVLVPKQVPGLANIVAISAGEAHSLALDNKGMVYVWGWNIDGQIGQGSEVSYVRAYPEKITSLSDIIGISAGMFNSVAIGKDGTIYAWGRNAEGQIDPQSAKTKIVSPFVILRNSGPIQVSLSPSVPASSTVTPTEDPHGQSVSNIDNTYLVILISFILLIAGIGAYIWVRKKK